MVELFTATVTCSCRGLGSEVRFTHLFPVFAAVTAEERRVATPKNCNNCMVKQ